MSTPTTVNLRSKFAAAWLALATLAVGCATTQQATIGVQGIASACAFLGPAACVKLTPTETPGRFSSAAMTGGGEPVAGWRYVNPGARWSQYTKVMILPVTFWGAEDSKVSPEDQQKLTNYFHEVIQQQLATKFEIVDEPGPGVMTIQAALIDAETATPVLRSISMVLPQARALDSLKYLASGTYAFVGGATVAVKILDSVTHQVLASAVDKRVGGGSIKTAAQWELGDAENAMTTWAEQLTTRLSSWKSGTPTA